jgi:DNA-binding HxlR family transcriptional regulator
MGKAIEMSVRLDRVLLDQIAGRWQLLILDALCDHGRKARFNVLKRAIPGISQKTLTQCLRQLERSGLVARRVLTDSPLGVEYSLTPLGDTLEAPVRALNDWTRQYSAAVRIAQEAYDADRSRKDGRSANKTCTEKINDTVSKKPFQKPSHGVPGATDLDTNPVGVRSVRTSNFYTSLTHRGCQWIDLRVRSAAVVSRCTKLGDWRSLASRRLLHFNRILRVPARGLPFKCKK